MASPTLRLPFAAARHNRLTGIAVTLAVHLALILAWQTANKLPAIAQQGSDEAMQWLTLPTVAPRTEPAPTPAPAAVRRPTVPAPKQGRPTEAIAIPVPAVQAVAPTQDMQQEGPALPSAESIMQNARRSVGAADRALRKESRPLILAPLDSPQIRMREGMEHARAMAPPRMWEAPKVEELVNNTGDGARRTRVISGDRTYCITNRAPTTNVEMIEMHGRQRFTNCPAHETPAKQQVWRTARD